LQLAAAMKFAYADPPYLGKCRRYGHHHPDGLCWDDLATHAALIGRLGADYPDGWALSGNSSTLRDILPLCPPDVRVAAWVKPFAAYKANVRIAYTWEPVIFRGGRASSKDGAPVGRDYIAQVITLKRGLVGAKPPEVCRWILDLLGFDDNRDTLDDLFPGTGIMARVQSQGVML
jgi:hypothetical protein